MDGSDGSVDVSGLLGSVGVAAVSFDTESESDLLGVLTVVFDVSAVSVFGTETFVFAFSASITAFTSAESIRAQLETPASEATPSTPLRKE